MNRRPFIAFIALMFMAAAAAFMDKSGTPQSSKLVGQTILQLSELDKIDEIQIQDGDQTLFLKKTKYQHWLLTGDSNVPATGIADFFDQMTRIKILRLVSDSADQWQSLSIDPQKTVKFLSQGQIVRSILTGKARAGGGQFVAFDESPTSYLIDQKIQYTLDRSSWESNHLISISWDRLHIISSTEASPKPGWSLQREKPDEEFRLQFDDQVELVPAKLQILKTMRSFFQQLSFIDSFGDDYLQTLKRPYHTREFRLLSFEGSTYRLWLSSLDDQGNRTRYFVRLSIEGAQDSADYEWIHEILQSKLYEIEAKDARKLLLEAKDIQEEEGS